MAETSLILASGSESRRRMLAAAGVPLEVVPARVDEEAARAAMQAEGVRPRDQADALAELKARQVSGRIGAGRIVLGADQVLEFEGEAISKAESREALAALLRRMRGKAHRLHSAAVICEDGAPLWRHVSTARLHMRPVSDAFLERYLDAELPAILGCVGGYRIEGLGVRLFDRVEGDHFAIQGLPLIEVLNFLAARGVIAA